MVAESREEVLERERRCSENEFLTLRSITFEGHEMAVSIRIIEIASVVEMTEDRWQFELGQFMIRRQAEEAQQRMFASSAGMAEAIQSDING